MATRRMLISTPIRTPEALRDSIDDELSQGLPRPLADVLIRRRLGRPVYLHQRRLALHDAPDQVVGHRLHCLDADGHVRVLSSVSGARAGPGR